MSRIGIRIGSEVGPLKLDGNTIDGFATAILDERG